MTWLHQTLVAIQFTTKVGWYQVDVLSEIYEKIVIYVKPWPRVRMEFNDGSKYHNKLISNQFFKAT